MERLQETTYSRAMKETIKEKMEDETKSALSSIESYQRTITRQKESLERDLQQLANDPAYTGMERMMREKQLKFNAELHIARQEGAIKQQQNIIAFIEESAHILQDC